MLGKIIGITDSIVSVHLDINIYDYDNLISKNVVFRDNNIISVGEVIGIDNGIMNAALVGEIKDNKLNEKSYNLCIQILNDIFNFYISGYPNIPDEYLYHEEN